MTDCLKLNGKFNIAQMALNNEKQGEFHSQKKKTEEMSYRT